MRTLALLLLLPLASSAQAQPRSAIVKSTPDGFVLADVPDGPVTDGPAVLITLTSPDDVSSGWTLRVLREGENPMETLRSRGDGVRFTRETRRRPDRPARVRLRGERIQITGDEETYELVDEILEDGSPDGRTFYYEVTARMERGFAVTDPVVAELSEAPALDALTLQSQQGYTTVEVRFRFESLEALNAWRDAGVFESVQERASAVAEKVSVR